MPTYVYECQVCERVFEVDQRITEDPIRDCECGAKGQVKRLIQPVAVSFKGSGFYVNDSTAAAPAAAKADESKPEDKPAAAPEPTKAEAPASVPESKD